MGDYPVAFTKPALEMLQSLNVAIFYKIQTKPHWPIPQLLNIKIVMAQSVRNEILRVVWASLAQATKKPVRL